MTKKTIEIEVSGQLLTGSISDFDVEGRPVSVTLTGLTAKGLQAFIGPATPRGRAGTSEIKVVLAAETASVVFDQQASAAPSQPDEPQHPVLNLPPSLQLIVGEPFSFAIEAQHADSVEVNGALPSGLVYDEATRTIMGTPTGEFSGSVVVKASNLHGVSMPTLPITVVEE